MTSADEDEDNEDNDEGIDDEDDYIIRQSGQCANILDLCRCNKIKIYFLFTFYETLWPNHDTMSFQKNGDKNLFRLPPLRLLGLSTQSRDAINF